MSTKSKSTKHSPAKRSDVHVKVYLETKAEKELLTEFAKKAGLRVSPFLRNLAMEAIRAERRTA